MNRKSRLEETVRALQKNYNLRIEIQTSPDRFQPTGVLVRGEGSFQAHVLFREPKYCSNDEICITRVTVAGPDENEVCWSPCDGPKSHLSQVGVWGESQLLMFREITDNACRELPKLTESSPGQVLSQLVVSSPLPPLIALTPQQKWLSFHSSLTTSPCAVCKTSLRYESKENPVSLPLNRALQGNAIHPSCYSQI